MSNGGGERYTVLILKSKSILPVTSNQFNIKK